MKTKSERKERYGFGKKKMREEYILPPHLVMRLRLHATLKRKDKSELLAELISRHLPKANGEDE